MGKFQIGEKAFIGTNEVTVAGLEPGAGYPGEFVRVKTDRGATRIVHQSELSRKNKKAAPKPKAEKVEAKETETVAESKSEAKPKKKTTSKKSTSNKKSTK